MWRKHHEREILKPQSSDQAGVLASESSIIMRLTLTRKFLHEQFKGHPTVPQYQRLVSDLTLIRWLTLEKMSPYYGILSPLLKKALGSNVEEAFMFDFEVYRKSLTPSIQEQFEIIFPEEF
jgi:hypothetical protein